MSGSARQSLAGPRVTLEELASALDKTAVATLERWLETRTQARARRARQTSSASISGIENLPAGDPDTVDATDEEPFVPGCEDETSSAVASVTPVELPSAENAAIVIQSQVRPGDLLGDCPFIGFLPRLRLLFSDFGRLTPGMKRQVQ